MDKNIPIYAMQQAYVGEAACKPPEVPRIDAAINDIEELTETAHRLCNAIAGFNGRVIGHLPVPLTGATTAGQPDASADRLALAISRIRSVLNDAHSEASRLSSIG